MANKLYNTFVMTKSPDPNQVALYPSTEGEHTEGLQYPIGTVQYIHTQTPSHWREANFPYQSIWRKVTYGISPLQNDTTYTGIEIDSSPYSNIHLNSDDAKKWFNILTSKWVSDDESEYQEKKKQERLKQGQRNFINPIITRLQYKTGGKFNYLNYFK